LGKNQETRWQSWGPQKTGKGDQRQQRGTVVEFGEKRLKEEGEKKCGLAGGRLLVQKKKNNLAKKNQEK